MVQVKISLTDKYELVFKKWNLLGLCFLQWSQDQGCWRTVLGRSTLTSSWILMRSMNTLEKWAVALLADSLWFFSGKGNWLQSHCGQVDKGVLPVKVTVLHLRHYEGMGGHLPTRREGLLRQRNWPWMGHSSSEKWCTWQVPF